MGNPNCYFMIIAVAFFFSSQSPRGTVVYLWSSPWGETQFSAFFPIVSCGIIRSTEFDENFNTVFLIILQPPTFLLEIRVIIKISKNPFETFCGKFNFKNNLFLKLDPKIVNFLSLSTLSVKLQNNFRCNFCDYTSISFIVMSFI